LRIADCRASAPLAARCLLNFAVIAENDCSVGPDPTISLGNAVSD
jgi:hypothetical protein